VTDVVARFQALQQRIDDACLRAGRPRDDVHLVAVSKTHPLEAVEAVAATGHVDFGESYAQELRDKAAARADLRWHFIGRLQSNKAKYVAPVAYRVHALERLDHAQALAKRAPRPLKCLVAVNVAGEASKGGVPAHEALDAVRSLDQVDGIEICGLMTLPPAVDDPQDAAPWFAQLAELAAEGRARGLALTELSMGMTHDFEVAIAHGATWIRVGTAIFGPRER
jgi:hypothetical protein